MYKNYTFNVFPLTRPLSVIIHYGGSHSYMWHCIYGCNLIQNQDIFFSKLKEVKKKLSFLGIFRPSSVPLGFLRMSPGFVMSGEVQAIISIYVPNSTL